MRTNPLLMTALSLALVASAPAGVVMYENFEPINGYSHRGQIMGINGWGPGAFTDPCAMVTWADDIAFNVKGILAAQPFYAGTWGGIKKQFPVQLSGIVEVSFFYNESGNNSPLGNVFAAYVTGGLGEISIAGWPGPTHEKLKYGWKDGNGAEVLPWSEKTFAQVGLPPADRSAWYEYKITYDIDRDHLSLDIRQELGTWSNIISFSGPGVPIYPSHFEIHAIRFASGNANAIAIDNIIVENVPQPTVCGDEGTVYQPADLTEDCYVNLADLGLFAADWLTCTDPCNPIECDPNSW